MLFVFGALVIDTRPFNADEMYRTSQASLAQKSTLEGFQPSEFMGEGEETITLSGKLAPLRVGGLSELEFCERMCKDGFRAPLMRGDGRRFGTYQITNVREHHSDFVRSGVGFFVHYTLNLKKVQGGANGASVINSILSVFNSI